MIFGAPFVLMPGGALWSPANTTTTLWLDAADAGTITSAGGVASEWRDKSGNDHHLAATGSAQPSTGAVFLNGLNSISFGADDVMTRADSLGLTGNPGYAVLMVSRPLNGSSVGAFGIYTSTVSTVGKSIAHNPSDGSFRYNNGNEAHLTGAANGSTWLIGAWQRANGANYAGGSYRENGTSIAATGSVNPSFTPNLTSPYGTSVGGQISGDPSLGFQFFECPIAEIVVLPNGAAMSVIELVEGYLAWKWGLVSGLAAGHPYKSSAP